MADESLARRYARAMVALAQEANAVDQIEHQLGLFDAALDSNDGILRSVLSNPGITTEERRAVLDRVIAGQPMHAHTRNLLRLLADKNRFGAYHGIRKAYSELADELAGRVRATVTTARQPGPLFRYHAEKALSEATKKQVIVTYKTDSSLIGGVVAQVGDTIYDASVRARLQSLEDDLVHGAMPGLDT